MNIEGRLTISLRMARDGAQDSVSDVDIVSSRPVHASRVFIGKQLADVQNMLPLLFSLCGTAQACAGARACEQSLGKVAAEDIQHLRDSLVSMESLREHLWRILLDWPTFIGTGASPDKAVMAEMVQLQRDYRLELCGDGEPFKLHANSCESDWGALRAVQDRLSLLLQHSVFGMSPQDWLDQLTEREALADWAAERRGTAASLIDQLLQQQWAAVGACESAHLPSLDESLLHQAMQDRHYIEQPSWQGQCYETTSLSRVGSPLLSDLQQFAGNGLLVRLVARLSEIALLCGRLMPQRQSASEVQPVLGRMNPGIGQVAAARGQLVHRVELAGEKVKNYQILAPTEWNFHPKGVVVRSLLTLKGPLQQVERQARLLINAIDPCVGYELKLA